MNLRPFQRRFLRAAFDPDTDVACLSTPRGAGKSTLSGWLAARALTPGDKLFRAGSESILVAGSVAQARIIHRIALGLLPDGGADYSVSDNNQSLQIRHRQSKTTLRAHAANSRTMQGILGPRLILADEAGAWPPTEGQRMWDALRTSIGKLPMTMILTGTIWPSLPGGWWARMVQGGSGGGTHVTLLQGDVASWDSWRTIQKCNPLAGVNKLLRRTLIRERNAARLDPALKASFLNARLNVPTADESRALLTAAVWQSVCGRPVAPRGRFYTCGVDAGGARAWSSVCGVWPQTGRVEALAFSPFGAVEALESRDRVPRGQYARLLADGALRFDGERRVPRVSALLDAAVRLWGRPAVVCCDGYRYGEVLDGAGGRFPVAPRRTGSRESDEDVAAVRRLAGNADPGLSVEKLSRRLLDASLAVSEIKTDDQGHSRMVKRDLHSQSRDDVAVSLHLACGAAVRMPAPSVIRLHVA